MLKFVAHYMNHIILPGLRRRPHARAAQRNDALWPQVEPPTGTAPLLEALLLPLRIVQQEAVLDDEEPPRPLGRARRHRRRRRAKQRVHPAVPGLLRRVRGEGPLAEDAVVLDTGPDLEPADGVAVSVTALWRDSVFHVSLEHIRSTLVIKNTFSVEPPSPATICECVDILPLRDLPSTDQWMNNQSYTLEHQLGSKVSKRINFKYNWKGIWGWIWI